MTRGRPFQPGNKSGRGRPRGSRNKTSLIAQELLDSHAEALIRKALVLALKGDPAMLRILLGAILPRPKDVPVKIGPLPMDTTQDLIESFNLILQKLSTGQLTVGEAKESIALIESRRKLIETHEFDARLRSLEELNKALSGPPQPSPWAKRVL